MRSEGWRINKVDLSIWSNLEVTLSLRLGFIIDISKETMINMRRDGWTMGWTFRVGVILRLLLGWGFIIDVSKVTMIK